MLKVELPFLDCACSFSHFRLSNPHNAIYKPDNAKSITFKQDYYHSQRRN